METIRYYQRRGLLPEPKRIRAAIRRYGPEDIQRLRDRTRLRKALANDHTRWAQRVCC